MQLGCDVICEKPMTTDAGKARAIFDAIESTGRSLRVTFNYRYAPANSKLRQLLAAGTIGRPLHVDFSWLLDTSHGADYFRRWHREKHNSGGLLVHKATHHFDLVNWWLASRPQQVFALGNLMFYGAANAAARGEYYSYARYTGEEAARDDPFALFLDQDPGLRGLYLDAEAETGYLRDRNVFGDPITIEDTLCVTARYRNAALLSYSLVAYAPWEGYRVAITGTRGRLELEVVEKVHTAPASLPLSLRRAPAISGKRGPGVRAPQSRGVRAIPPRSQSATSPPARAPSATANCASTRTSRPPGWPTSPPPAAAMAAPTPSCSSSFSPPIRHLTPSSVAPATSTAPPPSSPVSPPITPSPPASPSTSTTSCNCRDTDERNTPCCLKTGARYRAEGLPP